MITRNIPLISRFPDFTVIQTLSQKFLNLEKYKPLFYDIETTGLSSAKSYCYLIGCIVFEEERFHLHQWFAEDESEEASVLEAFLEFSKAYTYTIQYNGDKFDQPYLKARCEVHGLTSPLEHLPALDLYKELKPCRHMLKFDHMKQPDLELFLGVEKRIFADGKICIKCYKDYSKKKDQELLSEVLGHNLEDLCGLGRIFEMLTYRLLFCGDYAITHAAFHQEELVLHFQLPFPVPAPFSCGKNGVYLTGKEQNMKLLIASPTHRLKMYYPNYKEYAYLPAEDTAIPKSLSSYIDKSLKKPARPETCYTWFEINSQFLDDFTQQYKYLTHLLDFFLNHLN